MPPEDIEGRLNGQREVLAVILAHLMAQSGDSITRRLDALLEPADHQEDPGAVPESAFAVAGGKALEVKALIDRARAMVGERS